MKDKSLIRKAKIPEEFLLATAQMMGLAGDNFCGSRPYPKYSVSAKDYEFTFNLEPVF